jgi:hypothetical protein
MRDRTSVAQKLLEDHKAAATSTIIESVTDALDFTRDRLRDLLSQALGIDDEQASAAALHQAIADAARTRTKMLGILGA